MFNYNQIIYSLKHRNVVRELAKKYVKDPKFQEYIYYHDMDKILLYLQDNFINAHKMHETHNVHHLLNNTVNDKNTIIEAILDWESSRYTKPDKTLNAKETLYNYYSNYIEEVLPILEELNIIDVDMDKEILNRILSINYDTKYCLNEICDYIEYLKNNNIKLYYDIDKIIYNALRCMPDEEQLILSNRLGRDFMQNLRKEEKKVIGLFTHKEADYDAICSTVTLANYINNICNEEYITVIPIIEASSLLKNIDGNIKTYTLEEVKNTNIDIAIVCDVNELDRIYGLDKVLEAPVDARYVIDHHDKNRKELETLKSNKLIFPTYSSTCEIIIQLLNFLNYNFNLENAKNLFRGVAADTLAFKRNVSDNTTNMINYLALDSDTRISIVNDLTKISEEQIKIYEKIKEENIIDNVKVFTLLLDESAGDITKLIKHEKFDLKTAPNEENPVSLFIIGIGNNYFIKFKKLPECDIDILNVAIKCNGGGHETRCAGRFYNTEFSEVVNILNEEFNKIFNPSENNIILKKEQ